MSGTGMSRSNRATIWPSTPRGTTETMTPRACLPNTRSRCATPFSVSRTEYLTDEQWSLIEPSLPSSDGCRGRSFRDNRRVVEGSVYRYRAGIA
ncbi:transposase [Rhodococcus sp. TAF43]